MARLLIPSLCTASSLDCASMKSPCTFLLQPSVLGCQCLVLTPTEQAQSQTLPSLLGCLGVEDLLQPMGSWGQEKGERSGQIRACPCSRQTWESRQSLLAVHQESSRLSQCSGLVSCCSGLFPEKGKGGKSNKREMSESGLCPGSGPAAAALLVGAPANKKMEQRRNQLLCTLGTPSPLTGDSPEPPWHRALQQRVPIPGGWIQVPLMAPQEQEPGLDP